jgi:hypothetical protein
MKSLIILLFPIASWSQGLFMEQGRIYALKMHVLETSEFKRFCTRDTVVVWGTNFGDTTCFMFNGMIKCFYPVSRKVWGRTEDRELIEQASKTKRNTYVRQDRLNERYHIKFIPSKDGLAIFIVNIDFGMPNYVLTWSVREGTPGCAFCDH